ncbi:signal peptidase II [Rhodoligotrophos defluvii]|uniref:signal peptidase II n=1 Tax=Rhodoligotrophos defluvii TaxID=2561934 RepID=UPI0019601CB8|nr:signal peptidase II [Rhodoligotrophos defluvii]
MTGAGRRIGIACAVAAFALDQGTKVLALGSPALSTGLEVLPVLNLVLVRNSGVSFGMLDGLPWWALTLLGLTIVAALSVWLSRAQSRFISVALGLAIGGALGNLFDRLRHEAVTDFLDFHVAGYHWPAFNLADAAVVCGVGLLLVDGLLESRGRNKTGGVPDA